MYTSTAATIAVLLTVLANYSEAVANVHTVVPVECTNGYFEWQVLGFAYR